MEEHDCGAQEIDYYVALKNANEKEMSDFLFKINNKNQKEKMVLLLTELLRENKKQTRQVLYWISMDRQYHEKTLKKIK